MTFRTDILAAAAGMAYSAAMAEFILTACPECNAEFAAENQVYTGAVGTPGYALNCTWPMVTA